MTPHAAAILDLFKQGHHGPEHGLAIVLTDLASDYGDSIPADDLLDLALQLTADIPAPYVNHL